MVWLPQTDTVEIRDVRADAPLSPAEPLDQLRWWHHGSSISHCIEADDAARSLAGGRRRPARSRRDQSRLRRERPPRSVHRAGDAGFGCRPVQPEDRHQHRRRRHHEAAHVRSRRARIPRHDPRRRPDGPDPRDLADPLPDARRHAGPDRHRPRDRRATRNTEHDAGLLRAAAHPARGARDPARDRPRCARRKTPRSSTSTGWTCSARTTSRSCPTGFIPSPAGYLLIADRFAGIPGRVRVDLHERDRTRIRRVDAERRIGATA